MRKNIKKFISVFLSIMVTMGAVFFGSSPAYAASEISVFVDGEELYMDVPPIIMDGRTMVPLRAVSEAVGCNVDWFGEDQRIVVYSPAGGDPIMVMNINDPNVTLNYYNGDTGEITGEVETIETPPVIVNGRTMVPLRFIAETIGFDVDWDGNTRTVYLYSALSNSNFAELPDSVIYSEEYQIAGDPGEGLTAIEAAEALVQNKLSYVYDLDDTDEPVYITLIGLQFVEGSECYVFEVGKAQYTRSVYAVDYSGNIYENILFES